MKEIFNYLKSCGVFYISTVEDDQPRVRPFNGLCIFEDKLYICTNNGTTSFKQLLKNPKIEISSMHKDTWIRLSGEAKLDPRREAKVAMLESNGEDLRSKYSADDNFFEVFYIENATATIFSFTEEPKTIEF